MNDDIVAHEMGHAFTNGLGWTQPARGGAQAISEGVADLFTLFEYARRPVVDPARFLQIYSEKSAYGETPRNLLRDYAEAPTTVDQARAAGNTHDEGMLVGHIALDVAKRLYAGEAEVPLLGTGSQQELQRAQRSDLVRAARIVGPAIRALSRTANAQPPTFTRWCQVMTEAAEGRARRPRRRRRRVRGGGPRRGLRRLGEP